jgi:hypothetical protein
MVNAMAEVAKNPLRDIEQQEQPPVCVWVLKSMFFLRSSSIDFDVPFFLAEWNRRILYRK